MLAGVAAVVWKCRPGRLVFGGATAQRCLHIAYSSAVYHQGCKYPYTAYLEDFECVEALRTVLDKVDA